MEAADKEAADEQRLIRDAFDRPAGLFDAAGNRLDLTVAADAPGAGHDGTVADRRAADTGG